MALYLVQFAGDFRDAAADAAAIHFQLGFARPARADAAAQTGHHHTQARQPRQLVLHLRQLDLQLALARRGAHGENIQNQRRAVHHAAADDLLQIAHLRARQFVVHDQQIDIRALHHQGNIPRFARADVGAGVHPRAVLVQPSHHLCTCGIGQALQLQQRGRVVRVGDADDDGALRFARFRGQRIGNAAVRVVNLAHQSALRQMRRRERLGQQELILPLAVRHVQKRGGDRNCPAFCVHADGRHRIQFQAL